MTLESESGLVKREADKSYKLGADRSQPDLVIEVVVTSGGLNKLEAYRRLGIPEVWFWEDSQLAIYWLSTTGAEVVYTPAPTSQLLPQLDMPEFLACVNMAKHVDAIRTFQQSLQTKAE